MLFGDVADEAAIFKLADSIRERPKRVRDFPSVLWSALRLAWSAGPLIFVWTTLVTILVGAGAGVVLLKSQVGIKELLAASSGRGSLRSALLAFVPVLVVSSSRRALGAAGDIQKQKLFARVNVLAQHRVLTVAARAELIEFESPEFSNRLRQASLAGQKVSEAAGAATGLIGGMATFVSIALVIFAISSPLVLLVILACVPGWMVSIRISKWDYNLLRSQLQTNRVIDYLRSSLVGRDQAKEIRAFGLARMLIARWEKLSQDVIDAQYRLARKSKIQSLGAAAADALLFALAGAFFMWLIVSGETGLASATVALYGIQQLRNQVRSILFLANKLYAATFLIGDLDDLWLEYSTPSATVSPSEVAPFEQLRVDSLSFVYPGSEICALDEIDLHLNQGEVVALVGENGSGKTTLAKLLAGLYSPQTGSITWDGIDVRTMDAEQVRDKVAVIFQDFVKWEFTVRENIAFGRPDMIEDDARIRVAADSAGVGPLVSSLPDAYDTVLSKTLANGSDLSVGQWQRLALARAFFRDAPFIVLDEPTSALDARAEYELFQGIRTLYKGRTVLLISHRFSSVRSADRIYVLHEGRIVEKGTHEDLMSQNGRYSEMYNIQAQAYLA